MQAQIEGRQEMQAQVEGHPYFRNDALIDFCRAKNIHVTVSWSKTQRLYGLGYVSASKTFYCNLTQPGAAGLYIYLQAYSPLGSPDSAGELSFRWSLWKKRKVYASQKAPCIKERFPD
eukprot:1153552-Pelagomonas_calceolata.AAC.4